MFLKNERQLRKRNNPKCLRAPVHFTCVPISIFAYGLSEIYGVETDAIAGA